MSDGESRWGEGGRTKRGALIGPTGDGCSPRRRRMAPGGNGPRYTSWDSWARGRRGQKNDIWMLDFARCERGGKLETLPALSSSLLYCSFGKGPISCNLYLYCTVHTYPRCEQEMESPSAAPPNGIVLFTYPLSAFGRRVTYYLQLRGIAYAYCVGGLVLQRMLFGVAVTDLSFPGTTLHAAAT